MKLSNTSQPTVSIEDVYNMRRSQKSIEPLSIAMMFCMFVCVCRCVCINLFVQMCM